MKKMSWLGIVLLASIHVVHAAAVPRPEPGASGAGTGQPTGAATNMAIWVAAGIAIVLAVVIYRYISRRRL